MFERLNHLEAVLWAVIGTAFLIRAIGSRRSDRRRCLVAAGAFVLFGASDVVEAGTGAWWRPWWLLAWKAGCLAVLSALLADHLRRRRASKHRDD